MEPHFPVGPGPSGEAKASIEGNDAFARLRRARALRKTAAFLIALGVVGAGFFALRESVGGAGGAHDLDHPRASRGVSRRAPDSVRARPEPTTDPVASGVARGPTRLVTVRADGRPVAGAQVRLVRLAPLDGSGGKTVELSPVARTNAEGEAAVVAGPDLPADALLEAAHAGPDGLRHALVPWPATEPPAAPAVVDLPAGGSLRVEMRDLPSGTSPRWVFLRFHEPTGPWRERYDDVARLAFEDGGALECELLPRERRLDLDADGVGTLACVPADLAVQVMLVRPPQGRVVGDVEIEGGGTRLDAEDDVLVRVPEGGRAVYAVRWRAQPEAQVRVRGPDGAPVRGATVGFVWIHASGHVLRNGPPVETDDAGVARAALWAGTRLPRWTPKGLAAVVSAPDRLARVVALPDAWYGTDVAVDLSDAPRGAFRLVGRATFEGGGNAPGVPLRLATPAPCALHLAVPPLLARTEADGSFAFEVPEALRPVFERAEGIAVAVDDEALEAMSEEAMWRGRWRTLPRARVEPARLALPAPGDTARIAIVLHLPE